MPASVPKKLPKPLPPVPHDETAESIIDEAGAWEIMPAVAMLEGQTQLTEATIRGVGMGSPSGVALYQCTTAAEKAASRQEISRLLIGNDRGRLMRLVAKEGTGPEASAERVRRTMLLIARCLDELMRVLAKRDAPAPTAPLNAPPSGNVERALLVQSEEERSYSYHQYSVDNMKAQQLLVKTYYNLKFHAWELPTLGGFKKIAYAVLVDEVFPSPDRVTLESLRRDKSDTACTLFRRLMFGVVVVAAGAKVKLTVRDDGAGALAGKPPQWMHGEQASELVKEVDELRDANTNEDLMSLVKTLHASLYKATSRGGESPSLCTVRLIGRVPELIAPVRSRGNKRSARDSEDDDGAFSTPSKKGRRGGKAAQSPGTRATVKKARFEDKAGAKGPNGLPRMVGGNPKGDPCPSLKNHGKCKFATCSFSHA